MENTLPARTETTARARKTPGRAGKDVVSHRNFVGEGTRLDDDQNVVERKKSVR
jgi:hypothetical protein